MNRIAKSLCSAAIGVLALAGTASHSQAKELRSLAWEGYADPDWVKEFEEQTGAYVNVFVIRSDDELWAMIKGGKGRNFDLFAVNTAQLQRYLDLGATVERELASRT